MNNRSTNTCPKCGAVLGPEAPQGLCPSCVLAVADTRDETHPPSPEAGARNDVPSLELVAAEFPQLEVLDLIGRGGMGCVFKARQVHLDRLVALKLLPNWRAADPHFAERFHREGRVLAKLSHPNIVSIYDFGRTEHFCFLVMEYVDGVNLRQAMQTGRFSPAEALSIVPRICEALQFAHDHGVLHRDIKPENILLDGKGGVKIADFGIAKLVDKDPHSVTLTGAGAALGTPHYMAPEQLEKPSEVDHRADIYSLGVVFYEMLTGELPIGRFAPPSAKTPVATSVDDVVFRTLEKDREKRYQSAADVKTRVEHLTHSGAATRPDTPDAEERDHSPEVPPGVFMRRPYAFRAFAGAGLVGISLALPMTVVASLLTGRGGVGPAELWLSLGSVALPGLGGTIVGWLGLNEIRDSRGTVRGLPLALFATLAWPLLLLVGLALGLPLLLSPPAGGGPLWARFLVLLLPAAVLTFALWAVYATAQWASSRPPAHKRGVLWWVFTVLLISGYGLVLLWRSGAPTAGRATVAPMESRE